MRKRSEAPVLRFRTRAFTASVSPQKAMVGAEQVAPARSGCMPATKKARSFHRPTSPKLLFSLDSGTAPAESVRISRKPPAVGQPAGAVAGKTRLTMKEGPAAPAARAACETRLAPLGCLISTRVAFASRLEAR